LIDYQKLFVERKEYRDTRSRGLAEELQSALCLPALKSLRILSLYEISGISGEILISASSGLLYEPNNDVVNTEIPGLEKDERIIARELLPGLFDQRADSAQRGLKLVFSEADIKVHRSDIFILKGNLSREDEKKIRKWLINPVESREKNITSSSLGEMVPDPLRVPLLSGFCRMDINGLTKLRKSHGLALALEDLSYIRSWFDDKERRDPTLAEIKALDTYWSDHCRHTTFETELISITVEKGPEYDEITAALSAWDEARRFCHREGKPRTLMDLATIAARESREKGELEDWDVSDEINACTLKVDALIDGKREPWLLSFKNETHNHPTEIEPYGGASTCLGGAVRDPLSGRAYVHQALRITGGADPRQNPEETRAGKLPQRLIAHGAAGGYAGYGNQLGLATAFVREFYHPGYEAKRLECGAVMGASPAAHVIREEPIPGDNVILVGGRTGRDGIGGATGSSVAHDGDSLEKAGAEVQKGNPPEERKLQRLFRNTRAAGLIRRCNDFGAGGVAVAVGELSEGLDINLDALPVKYQGLNGLELALSESQERMAVVVHPEDAHAFIQYAEDENLEAVVVAEVTGGRRLRMNWRGESVINLSRDLLDTNGVRREARARIAASADSRDVLPSDVSIEELSLSAESLKTVLSSVDLASRRGLEERFDGSVGGTTVLASHGGARQLTPVEASVHLLPFEGDVETAGVMSVGFDPSLATISPFRAGQYALIEALARFTAVGGNWRKVRFSLQEFFGRTDRGDTAWGEPLAALLGALTVQRKWGLPAIGGKDSMSGSYEEISVPPTIIAFAAAAMDAPRAVSAALRGGGLTIALVSGEDDSGESAACAPEFERLAAGWDWVESLGGRGHLKSAASVGKGGWAAKLVLMCLGNDAGVDLGYTGKPFKTDYGALIVASDFAPEELLKDAEKAGAELTILGRSLSESGEPHEAEISWPGGSVSLKDVGESWRGTFDGVWPEERSPDETVPLAPEGSGSLSSLSMKISSDFSVVRKSDGKPNICIPVFPGTNGEDDALRAFNRAGGRGVEHIFQDRDSEKLNGALAGLAGSIDKSQILYISGGFSAGDEPDGAGKYIAAVLREEQVAESLFRLLERGGLVLGICNGFQALIKSGWLINGSPGIPGVDDPTLTHNRIGRHVARVVRTVAAGGESPWLSGIHRGDVHCMPVSHGEGRFTAALPVMEKLAASGRIAFQYCDENGVPGMGGDVNPNGSDMAVEGILSPCGRILGKMGHSERWRKGTLIDIPGMESEQPLISGGVGWFL